MFSLFDWKKSEMAFTVVVLVAILAVSQAQLRIGQMKTRDAQRKSDLELVARALNRFYAANEYYPPAKNGLILSCGDVVDLVCEWGRDGIRDLEGKMYINRLPVDPLFEKGRQYVYELDESGKKYRLYAALEYRRDEDWKDDLTIGCGLGLQCNWHAGNF